MPRKGLRPRDRRPAPPADFRFNSVLISRLVNRINFQGKKVASEKVVYGAMDIIKEKTKEDPMMVFTKAVENVRPLLEIRPRRVGGANYQVPIEVKPARGTALAMQWMLKAARERAGAPMSARLAEEILLAYKKEGAAFKKREDTHKMAEANRAFAHFRWW